MLIYTDYNKPYILDSLDGPLVAKYYWIFSGPMRDYTLSPITYLEETIGQSIEVSIGGFSFIMPATWNILVVDKETSMVDTVPISNCSLNSYHAVLMSSIDTKVRMVEILVSDLFPSESCIHPMINKGTMMCHPIGPEAPSIHVPNSENAENILNIMIGPHDLYSKYLGNTTIGDLLY